MVCFVVVRDARGALQLCDGPLQTHAHNVYVRCTIGRAVVFVVCLIVVRDARGSFQFCDGPLHTCTLKEVMVSTLTMSCASSGFHVSILSFS